ncbi:phosphotransferase [bacterium]|nr:phosphotransferase [bacterium]
MVALSIESETRQSLREAFIEASGHAAAAIAAIPGDASFRHYYRLNHGGQSYILMDAPPPKEDVRPFVNVGTILVKGGFSAPHILASDIENGFLLLEDLGDALFARLLAAGKAEEQPLYETASDLLVELSGQQTKNPGVPDYDHALLLREVMLFAEWFLPATYGKEKSVQLAGSFSALWPSLFDQLLDVPHTLVLRDYHAENLLWLPERTSNARVGLLDFQDATFGPITYDLVSLLEDARRDVSPATQRAIKARFFSAFHHPGEKLETSYALAGLQRNLKIVGIFTRLWLRDGKRNYLSLLPRVWGHIADNLRHPACAPVAAWMDANLPGELRAIPPV